MEAIRLRKDTLSPSDKMQLDLPLQIIQNEHPSADKAILPIGQISLHRVHLLHFSSSTLNGGLPSSLTHETTLSISKASVGQA
jgi:hypothetical protein